MSEAMMCLVFNCARDHQASIADTNRKVSNGNSVETLGNVSETVAQIDKVNEHSYLDEILSLRLCY